MKLPEPFAYPAKPHTCRHGPMGYSKYRHYRNWLRDEFSFRCVYCLRRENWFAMPRDHELDHFLAKSDHPDEECAYDNLVIACRQCNGTKSAKSLPSPEIVAYGDCLHVDDDGRIHAKNNFGEAIIEALRLDGSDYTGLRRDVIAMIREAAPGSTALKRLLGYPEELPDLSKERKPKSNKCPNGIHESHFARKQRDELPEYY